MSESEENVTLSKAEHDRLQAENRRLKKERADLEAADKERENAAAAARAIEAGRFDEALGVERAEKARLLRELQTRDAREAVRAEVASLGVTPEMVAACCDLVKLDAISPDDPSTVKAAVDAAKAAYPAIFADSPAPRRRANSPAVPPEGQPNDGKPSGYVSPEEYMNTAHSVRVSREFSQRVENSKPFWPTKVPRTTFATETD